MGGGTCSGEEKGRPIPKPSTNAPGRGRPQIRVGVEPLAIGSRLLECLTAACKALSLANAKGNGTDGLVIRSLDD